MVVTITSEVFGKVPGETYTGPQEDWLLAQGYASQAAYAGVGVANTGATAVTPANDPTLAANREDPYWPLDEDTTSTIANASSDSLTKVKHPNPAFDVDDNATDDDAPSNLVITPNTGAAAGGTVVKVTGDNLDDATSVTFGGTAGTSFSHSAEGEITVTTPAKTAGAYDVVVVDSDGNGTKVGGFTYA